MSYQYRALYDRHLEYLEANDVDTMIERNYTPDAELLGFNVHVTGADALRPYFVSYLAQLGYLKVLSTDKYAEGDNSIIFEATMETAGGVAKVWDVWTLVEGKINKHYTGLISFVPHQT